MSFLLLPSPTHSFSGADGVDDWSPTMWQQQLRDFPVLLFIHDVFLTVLSRGYLAMQELALLVRSSGRSAVCSVLCR